VTWVIIIIVLVFDPLAVVLLLSSQYSFQWFRQQEEERKNELVQEDTAQENDREETTPQPQPDVRTADEGNLGEQPKNTELSPGDDVAEEANRKIAEIESVEAVPEISEESKFNEKDPLAEWNEMIAKAERAVEEEKELDDHEIIESVHETEKAQMKAWKADHPETSLKIQKHLHKRGKIDKLPWEDYLKARPDYENNEAAEEAAKWAIEQLEESKKKDNKLDGERGQYTDKEIQRTINGYIQNAEQNDKTLWQKVQAIKKAKDE